MMARAIEPDSDEEIWEYSTQRQKKTKSSATQQVLGGKPKNSPIIAQSQPCSVKGKGKGKGKSSTRPTPLSTQQDKSKLQDRKRGSNKANDGAKKITKSSAPKSKGKATLSQTQPSQRIGKKRKTPSKDDSVEDKGPPLKSPRLDRFVATPKLAKDTDHNKQNSTKKTQGTDVNNSKTPRTNNKGSSIPEIQIDTVNTPLGSPVAVPIMSVPKKEGHCPFCQMPFRCLVIESPRWHTTECMDIPLKTTAECPAGVKCDSTLPSHYRRYTHHMLANIRAGVSVSTVKPSPATNRATIALTPSQKAHIRRLDFGRTPSSTKPSTAVAATTSPYFRTETTDGLLTVPTSHSKKKLAFTSKKEEEFCECDCDSPGCIDSTICSGLAPLNDSPLSQTNEENEDIETDEDIFNSNPNQSTKVQETDAPLDHSNIPDRQCPSTKKNGPSVSPAVEVDKMRFETKDLSDMLFDALEEDGEETNENVAKTYEMGEEDDGILPDIEPELAPDTEPELAPDTEPELAPDTEPELAHDTAPGLAHDTGPELAHDTEPELAPDEVVHSDGEEDDLVFTALQEPLVIEPEDETINTDICILSTIPAASTPNRNNVLSPATPKFATAKEGTKQTSISNFFTFKNPKQEKQTTKGRPLSVLSSLSVPPPSDKKWSLPRPGSSKTEAVVPKASTSRDNSAAGRSGSSGWGGKKQKQCPFYKKMPGTPFTVDAFSYGTVPGCKAYILTHFHYDHYGGLTRKFNHPIYCSKITGNLVQSKIKVDPRYIHTIPLDTPRVVEGIELTFMEANHCPGSVIILFKLPNGQAYLHTGDFRACPEMERYPFLQSVHVNQLYLDTTYCDPAYAFPPQKDVINFAVAKVTEVLHEFPNTLVAVGSYTVGKERIFMAIAEELNCRICVNREKKVVLECLEDVGLKKRLTLEPRDARVHVVPMRQLKYESLSKYVNGLKPRFDRVLAFEPTGWTHAGGTRQTGLDKLRPKYHRDNVTIYGVPYSEHSSYTEMKRFCQVIRPDRILATVNNGSAESRAKMDKLFDSWMREKLESPSRLKQTGLKTWFK